MERGSALPWKRGGLGIERWRVERGNRRGELAGRRYEELCGGKKERLIQK